MAEILRPSNLSELAKSKPLIAVLALFSHFILNKFEYDNKTILPIRVWTVGFGLFAAAQYVYDPQTNTAGEVASATMTAAAVYFGTLVTSVLIYRGFFHRLRKFPGPYWARFSKLYVVFRFVLPERQYYKKVEAMHKQYKTDVVRTGPRELSVACADAVPVIHGPMSKCRKGPWYNNADHMGGVSTHTTRSKLEHRQRRKMWDHAFNAKSLREYEPRLNRHAMALMEKLKEHASEPSLRISNWINFYSFDVMGDIGFSRSFGMVEKGEEDDLIKALHASMSPFSIFGQINWGADLLLRAPAGNRSIVGFMEWAGKVLKERKKITPKEKDVFGWLLDPNDEDVPAALNADSRLMIVAGSDTTAATLTWLAYELCKNPNAQARLRKLVDDMAPGKSFLEVEDVANCPYLDGVINEALRLHPAVPSGVQRETPPEGVTLPNGTYIPGETLIWMPIHTLQRDPRYWREPLKYMPERWTEEASDYIIDKRAFMPFSTGVYNCVGQKLAMMEMRSVAANLIRLFEMRFADGEDCSVILNKTQDCFTLNVGKLDVKLIPRTEA